MQYGYEHERFDARVIGRIGGCPDIATNFVTQVFRSVCVASVWTPANLFYLSLIFTGINTFSIVFLPQKVSPEMYRQLYQNIIRDIDVRS